MADAGFVYMLCNEYMQDIVKIGCTERSPQVRADELSKHTGVPYPFEVVCYIEVRDFQQEERNFHKWLEDERISPGREFFSASDRAWMVGLFRHFPRSLAFADAGVFRFLAGHCDINKPLPNPWARLEVVANDESPEAAEAESTEQQPEAVSA